MGIESEQLVFDYLSRIGDLAHGTTMTAAERARLVGGLRTEIDRLRAEQGGAQSKAAVRKILSRLGKPEDVVAGAAGGGGTAGRAPGTGTEVPGPREGSGADRSGGPAKDLFGKDRPGKDLFGKELFGKGRSGEEPSGDDRFGEESKISLWKRAAPRRSSQPEPPAPPPVTASRGASAPHLAGMDELGPEESDPDWWRLDPTPYGDGGGGGRAAGETVPGFVGGIELPELLKPPQDPDKTVGTRPGAGAADAKVPAPRPGGEQGGAAVGEGVEAAGGVRRRVLWPGGLPFRRGGSSGPRTGGVVEWAAALLLVAGAVAGSLIPLGVGWLAAWWSPRLSRTEAKWAAAGMPGVVAGGTLVWLWGRMDGRWGERIAQGGEGLSQALSGTWPVLLRIAAVASALFLVWRARRPKG